jgi:phosphate starvation-inducible protein PhoH and related proteins
MSKKMRPNKKGSDRKQSGRIVHETTTPEAGKQCDNSPYVFQRDKISFDLSIKELPWTDNQKKIIETFFDKNTKVLLLKGPAGTSKTTLAMYCGLTLLNRRRISDLVLVRSAVESSDSKLGFLPGDIAEKFNVYLTPFHDKFEELLCKAQLDRLEKDNRLTICPINFARGLHFSAKFVCADEVQNFSRREIHTLMSRIGEFSKVFLCGDPEQSDLPAGKSGFNAIYELFNNEESRKHGIFCMELGEEDIVRSELCRFITHKFKELNLARQQEEANKQQLIKENKHVDSWKPSDNK